MAIIRAAPWWKLRTNTNAYCPGCDGGDDAPQPNIDGAIAALQADSDLEIAMVGDQPLIDSLIEKSGYSGERMEVVPAEGVVGMAEKPTIAHRKKPNNSIAVCWRLMAKEKSKGSSRR
ncbi:MAG: hypothetical protein R3C11_27585 [Planctomycetaceae bacterium]